MAVRNPRSILVATDFTAAGANALRRALQLPLARGAELELLHVVPAALPADLGDQVERACVERLGHLAAEAAASREARELGVEVSTRIERGRAHEQIVLRARRTGAELVLLGHGARTDLSARLLGSVAERVVRRSPVAVVVVKQPPRRPWGRALIAVGPSDRQSRALIAAAVSMLAPRRARVELLHSYHLPFEEVVATYMSTSDAVGLRKQQRQQALNRLDALLAGIDAPRLSLAKVARSGDPRTELLAHAARRKADLIAIGMHGGSELRNALLGSTAEAVLRMAHCDVLVVPPVADR